VPRCWPSTSTRIPTGRASRSRPISRRPRATGVAPERVVEDVLLAPQAVKRMLEPEEVAETAAFLLGPGGRAFTGAPVVMDLGWTAR